MSTSATVRPAEIPVAGPLGPTPDRVDEPHWIGLREGELRIQRCRSCRTWIWGPKWICGQCHFFDLGWEAVDPVGRVFAWTRIGHPFVPELAPVLPVVSVVVELPAAGDRRVMGMLVDSGGEVRVGHPVRGVFEQAPDEEWALLRWTRTEDVA